MDLPLSGCHRVTWQQPWAESLSFQANDCVDLTPKFAPGANCAVNCCVFACSGRGASASFVITGLENVFRSVGEFEFTVRQYSVSQKNSEQAKYFSGCRSVWFDKCGLTER
jgi:hypothetical protein